MTIVVGETGAGKTGLINRALEDPSYANTAVILNDFGKTQVTGAVVSAAEDGMIALGSGCVCCTVRGALSDALEKLLRDLDNGRVGEIGRVVIEAAASADPAAVLGTIAQHPYLALRFHVDGIVAILRSGTAPDVLANNAVAVRQLAMADVVLVSGGVSSALGADLAALNPLALVADLRSVAIADLADHGGSVERYVPVSAGVAAAGRPVLAGEAGRIHAFAVARDRVLPAAAVDRFLGYVAALQGPNLIRVHGVVASDEAEAIAVEGIGGIFYPPLVIDRPPGSVATRFNVVARDLAQDTFAGYLDAFLNEAKVDTPDRAALTANPLAVAGFSSRSGKA